MTPPYGMVICHEESHIQMDECAGPEFFTGGAKVVARFRSWRGNSQQRL